MVDTFTHDRIQIVEDYCTYNLSTNTELITPAYSKGTVIKKYTGTGDVWLFDVRMDSGEFITLFNDSFFPMKARPEFDIKDRIAVKLDSGMITAGTVEEIKFLLSEQEYIYRIKVVNGSEDFFYTSEELSDLKEHAEDLIAEGVVLGDVSKIKNGIAWGGTIDKKVIYAAIVSSNLEIREFIAEWIDNNIDI